MKIAFFWTWDFSKNILKNILNSEKKVEIKLIVSQADKPIWRKKEILPTPVKSLALDEKIEVLQPEKLKENKDFFEKLKSLDLDFIVVVAYGKIIPKEILEIPKFWCINIHWSLLPLYRGASPIQESLKNWDEKTWLTIMFMSEGMDEWEMLAKKEVIWKFWSWIAFRNTWTSNFLKSKMRKARWKKCYLLFKNRKKRLRSRFQKRNCFWNL